MLEVHAYVEVEDVERGASFYTAALGLTIRRRLTSAWVELAGARLPIHLLGNRPPRFTAGTATLHRDFGRHWTPVHLDFAVDELDAAVARATAAGASVEREDDHPGLWRLASCADPFGNGFDLIELCPDAYDTLAGRTVAQA